MILITGGAGFIGSHLTKFLVKKYPNKKFINVDCLTYAGNLYNLKEIKNSNNHIFLKIDICNYNKLKDVFKNFKIEGVIHLAAESHVDRSILDPNSFVNTNIIGTINLLNLFKDYVKDYQNKIFYHVSTDEVYGSLGSDGLFTEETNYNPNSPYSASKASSDHFVRAYGETFKIPYLISNCSNNYGPNQFPEKLIPLMINNIIEEKPLPIYGDGKNIRDWLYVKDHVYAIDLIYNSGITNETFNIGGSCEQTNLDLVNKLCNVIDNKIGNQEGKSNKLINFVEDRLGHDKRYAIDSSKIQNLLNWKPSFTLDIGIENTVDWYLNNKDWLQLIKSKDYNKIRSLDEIN